LVAYWHETDMPMQSPMSAVGGSTDLAGDAARSLIPIVFTSVSDPITVARQKKYFLNLKRSPVLTSETL
jgi:hypothetical protein